MARIIGRQRGRDRAQDRSGYRCCRIFFTGLKIAMPRAVSATIVGEFLVGDRRRRPLYRARAGDCPTRSACSPASWWRPRWCSLSTSCSTSSNAGRCAGGRSSGTWSLLGMKLMSFVAGGRELFGAVIGDGIVTLNDRIGQPSLRAALAAGAMEDMREAAQRRQARPQARRCQIPAGDPASGQEFSAPASITARTPPRPGANCRSSRACSSASPTRWSATTAR